MTKIIQPLNLEIVDLRKSYMQRRWQMIILISRREIIELLLLCDYLSSNNFVRKRKLIYSFQTLRFTIFKQTVLLFHVTKQYNKTKYKKRKCADFGCSKIGYMYIITAIHGGVTHLRITSRLHVLGWHDSKFLTRAIISIAPRSACLILLQLQ